LTQCAQYEHCIESHKEVEETAALGGAQAAMEGDQRTHPIASIDAPGFKVDRQLAEDLRREVATLLSRNSVSFPGAQPVSFKTHHLDELRQRE
jgi:hypothetical protein